MLTCYVILSTIILTVHANANAIAHVSNTYGRNGHGRRLPINVAVVIIDAFTSNIGLTIETISALSSVNNVDLIF